MSNFNICEDCFESFQISLKRFDDLNYSNKIVDELLLPIQEKLKNQPIISIDDLRQFKLFEIAADKINDFTKGKHDFCIIDFWTPREEEIPLYALYVQLNDKKNGFAKYYENLNKLYKDGYIHKRIFDTNKIITRLKLFQPFILTNKANNNIDNDRELYIKFENIDSLLDEYEKSFNDSEFVLYLNKIYDECKKIFTHNGGVKTDGYDMSLLYKLYLGLTESISKSVLDFLSINQDPFPRGFENPTSAFLTYLFFFRKILPKEDYSEYIYFPATAPVLHSKDNRIFHRWIGGILFGFKEPTTINTRINYQNFTQNIISTVNQLYQLFSVKEEETKAKENAKRSAITQVMARNMSHNIGSHVLSRFKDKDDLLSAIDCIEIEQLKNNDETITETKIKENSQYKSSNLQLNQYNLKEIDKLAYFNEYLKNRMDFLADIATTDPSMENPLFLLKEIMNGIDKNRILLDRISGIAGNIKYGFVVRLKVNGEWKELKGNDSLYDFPLSIPNDVLGCQAFYIIIENIIRNITKHSKIEESEFNFQINIDVQEFIDNYDFYEIKIYDNLFREKSNIDDLVGSRNKAFNKPILESKTGRLRGEHLGTIEMEVCAAYLRKLPFAQIEDDTFLINENIFNIDPQSSIKVPNLIRAYTHEHDSSKKYSLGYKLYLRRPQTILIIDSSNSVGACDEEKEKLKTYGIWILNENDKGKFKYDAQRNYGHDFLVWLSEENGLNNFINSNNGGLPKRILTTNDFENNKFSINVDNPYETIKKVWIQYAKKIMNDKKISKISYKKSHDSIEFTAKNDNNNIAVNFYDHGKDWNSDTLYPDLVCSHHRCHTLNLFNANNEQQRAEYSECVLSKVIIIDERLQYNIAVREKKYHSNDVNILFNELFKKQDIILPSKDDADLNLPSFGELSENKNFTSSKSEADKIRKFINDNIKNSDFCVIHLGILEKMLPVNVDKSKEKINETIVKLLSDKQRKKLVITSGRGKPNNLPDDISFIPLSILENAVEILFDKFLLIKLLYNSRRTL